MVEEEKIEEDEEVMNDGWYMSFKYRLSTREPPDFQSWWITMSLESQVPQIHIGLWTVLESEDF